MKKFIFSSLLAASLASFAFGAIVVSKPDTTKYPYYDGCVLVYRYGADYSKCNNTALLKYYACKHLKFADKESGYGINI